MKTILLVFVLISLAKSQVDQLVGGILAAVLPQPSIGPGSIGSRAIDNNDEPLPHRHRHRHRHDYDDDDFGPGPGRGGSWGGSRGGWDGPPRGGWQGRGWGGPTFDGFGSERSGWGGEGPRPWTGQRSGGQWGQGQGPQQGGQWTGPQQGVDWNQNQPQAPISQTPAPLVQMIQQPIPRQGGAPPPSNIPTDIDTTGARTFNRNNQQQPASNPAPITTAPVPPTPTPVQTPHRLGGLFGDPNNRPATLRGPPGSK